MVPEINIWAVVAAALSSMVIGSIWYARPVFGNWWMKAARVEPTGKPVAPLLIVTLIVSFVTAAVLAGAIAIAQNFYGGSYLLNGVVTAVILWAGFTAARIITHDGFEGRPRMLTLLTIAHEFVTLVVMGLIIGLFG